MKEMRFGVMDGKVGCEIASGTCRNWMDARARVVPLLRERPERTAFVDDETGKEAWYWKGGRVVTVSLLPDPPALNCPTARDWLVLGIGLFFLGMLAVSYFLGVR